MEDAVVAKVRERERERERERCFYFLSSSSVAHRFDNVVTAAIIFAMMKIH